MAWGLARAESHHKKSWIKRFDPRFWTINFPRPMMGCVVSTAADSLRADVVFYQRNHLAGLIWEAEDSRDHPLLAYETARDFHNCRLSFRWRSQGLKALDAVHGPTLTIRGRDATGQARHWYVRLWNYAEGDPHDAQITLDFNTIAGGFLHPQEADAVYVGDIDDMFISLVAPDYDGSATILAAPQEGWVELSEITCSGSGSTLEIGDVALPENDTEAASGYDDSTHLTPARLVRAIERLGYRGDIVHYVGMSHYPRLEAVGNVYRVSLRGGVLNTPCARWHRAFADEAHAVGLGIIWSLSYELFNAYCWGDWNQRDGDGAPALTGWQPPSTLLSPAHSGAMSYLQQVARAFISIARAAGLQLKFQVGEPWWWTNPNGKLCAYDSATTRALGAKSTAIDDIRQVTTSAQKAMLDALGGILADSTAALVEAARQAAGNAELTSHILIFLPTVLDPAAPELRRCNVPLGWARPAFDVLQLEDYDWVTSGRGIESESATRAMIARLGYPIEEQHYFAGFVLRAEDRAQWHGIAESLNAAAQRGVTRRFVWALPQINRDGFVLLAESEEEDTMQAFDDVDFPIAIGQGASVAAEFSTQIIAAPSGHEQRISEWAAARMRYDVGPGARSEAEMQMLLDFFRARRGAARGFRFRDPIDHSSALQDSTGHSSNIAATDQQLGLGDGTRRNFALVKNYSPIDADSPLRYITHPVASTVKVALDGVETDDFTLEAGGLVLFSTAPAAGAVVSAGFLFDVPVRFAQDRLDIDLPRFRAGEAATVPLIEIRQGDSTRRMQ